MRQILLSVPPPPPPSTLPYKLAQPTVPLRPNLRRCTLQRKYQLKSHPLRRHLYIINHRSNELQTCLVPVPARVVPGVCTHQAPSHHLVISILHLVPILESERDQEVKHIQVEPNHRYCHQEVLAQGVQAFNLCQKEATSPYSPAPPERES